MTPSAFCRIARQWGADAIHPIRSSVIACQPTDQADWAQSSCASLVGPGFELSGQKIVGGGLLPDLGMEVVHLTFIDFGRFPAATLEHARCALQQSTLPLMDHRWMHAKLTGQLADRLIVRSRSIRAPSRATSANANLVCASASSAFAFCSCEVVTVPRSNRACARAKFSLASSITATPSRRWTTPATPSNCSNASLQSAWRQ